MPSEEEMRREIEALKRQGNEITDRDLDSTRRMKHLTNETIDIGTKTITELDAQGEQLDNIERNLDQVDANLNEADKNLNDLQKCCGLCVCPWNMAKRSNDYKPGWSEEGAVKDKEKVNTKGPPRVTNGAGGGDFAPPSGGYIQRITHDAREDEMDENLEEVAGHISMLKNMATDIGGEVTNQNEQLDRMQRKAEKNDLHVQDANKKAQKILRAS